MSSSTWQHTQVTSPNLEQPVSVLAAKDIPYLQTGGHKLQTLNIYTLPTTVSTGSKITSLPTTPTSTNLPQILVHIHGGAWRDPNLLSSSIEAAVAHVFSAKDSTTPLTTIISLNYTLSPFPSHPSQPYDGKDTSQPWRSAHHPDHIQDILHAFTYLKTLGLKDNQYILSGHSAGACLAFQASLFSAKHWSADAQEIPRPSALLGMNGLYGLEELVHGLGPSHEGLKDVYADLIGVAFGEESKWREASPVHVDAGELQARVDQGLAPKLVVVDQSAEDQLVPVNQATAMRARLGEIHGLEVVPGKRCIGAHAAPWEQGYMIWENVLDVVALLKAGLEV